MTPVVLLFQMGEHNIEDELIFKSNPGFVFHDSRGFETGSVKELDIMKKFMAAQGVMELEKQIHLVW